MGTRVLWTCPNGKHPGEIGRRRPRRDALIRFCLECSIETGKLVRRIVPSLEAAKERRAQSALTRESKSRLRREEREKAHFTSHGLDLREELKRVTQGRTGALGTALPTLRLRRASRMPRRLGFFRPRDNVIQVTLYPGISKEDLLETLTHEAAHWVAGYDQLLGGRRYEWHGVRWKTTFRAMCEEHLGVRPSLVCRTHGEVSRLLREKALAAKEPVQNDSCQNQAADHQGAPVGSV